MKLERGSFGDDSGAFRTIDVPAAIDPLEEVLGSSEAALRDGRRQFATLLKILSGIFYRCALGPPRTLTFISGTVVELTGREAEYFERAGRWADIVHPADAERVAAEVASAVADRRSFSITYRLLHASGESRWVRDRGRACYSTGGDPLVLEGVITDITAQKGLEQSLEDAVQAQQAVAERWRATLDIIPQMVWTMDADGKEYFNRRWLEFTGFTKECQPARIDLVHPDDRESAARAWKSSRRTGNPYECEYRLRHHGGTYRWILSRGQPERDGAGKIVAWYGTCTDIHESKLAQNSLNESERRFHEILDSMPQIVWSIAAGGDRPDYYNRRWYEFTGLTPGSIAGDEWVDLFHPDDRQVALDAWRTSRSADDCYESEYRLRDHSGNYRWVVSRGRAERDGTGAVVRWYGTCTDIHERVLARKAVQESEQRARRILDSVPQIIWCADAKGRVDYVSPQWTEYFGTPEEPLEGEAWLSVLHPDDRPAAVAAWKSSVRTGEPYEVKFRIAHQSGLYLWALVRALPRRNAAGEIVRWFGACTNIHDQVTAEERALWAADHDALTKLPNRLVLQHRMDGAISDLSAPGRNFALLLLDLDHFKRLNDMIGHDAGDALLEAFAGRLKAAARPGDVVCRLGGDEFAVLLYGVGSQEELDKALAAMMPLLAEPCAIGGRLVDCQVSIGAAIYPLHGSARPELLKNADIALYAAKAAGRGTWKLFQPHMRNEFQRRSAMLNLARDALRNDQIVPYYQPKIDLESGRVAGFEALLRWKHPSAGLQLPGTIAAAFEDLTVAAEISDRMIDLAIVDLRSWMDRGIDVGRVAINAAAAEFRRGDFAERLLQRLKDASIPTRFFHVEVTETVFLGRGAEFVERALKMLSAEGVKIALDDFGTGYASLSHLKQFPVDFIKIDRSFVRDVLNDPDAAAIVDAVIKLGRSLGIGIIGEGIETRAQHNFLTDLGCDIGQGYYYGKALPARRVAAMVQERGASRRAA